MDRAPHGPGLRLEEDLADAARSSGSADDLWTGDAEGLRQFLRWLTPLIFGFAGAELVAALAYRDGALALVGACIVGYGICLLVARRPLSHGRLLLAVGVIAFGLVPPDLVILSLDPTMLPTLAIVPLVAVGVALPFAGRRSMRKLLGAAWVWIVVVGVLGEVLPERAVRDNFYAASFRVTSLAAAGFMVLLCLAQFRTRMTRLASRERDAATRLRELDETKDTFLAAISHDLRAPLTTILGASMILERPGISESDRPVLAGSVTRNAKKLNGLLDDLLDLERLKRGGIEVSRVRTDLGPLVRNIVEDMDVPGREPPSVEVEDVAVPVDPPAIGRIVENLVTNAFRHTDPDAPIWVRVRPEPNGAMLLVDDAGPGVPADRRDTIFEPFQRGSDAEVVAGSGVGLFLVARFAELHGGRAWVEDREGGGASFRVFIPAGAEGEPSAGSERASA
jgi:signal transduction histidine kinase